MPYGPGSNALIINALPPVGDTVEEAIGKLNAQFDALYDALNAAEQQVTVQFKGEWASGVSYQCNDVVTDGDKTYICKNESGAPSGAATSDTTYWALLSDDLQLASADEAVAGTDNTKAVTPAGVSAAIAAHSPKENLTASAAPSASNDETEGYVVGSVWYYDGDYYVCTDATEGAAVWVLQEDYAGSKPDKPVIISVGQSEAGTGVSSANPEVVISAYSGKLGVPCGGMQVVVTLASDGSTVCDSGWIGAGRYHIPQYLTGNTSYKVKARYRTINGDVSDYSDEFQFTTGVKIFGRAQESGTSYLWSLIDGDGNYLDDSRYSRAWLMENVPALSGIASVVVDGQEMVQFPAYWAKAAVATSGDANGKFCYWIADGPAEGFVKHYGFYDPATGAELDFLQVGAYEASTDASDSTKAASVANASPRTNLTVGAAKTMCAARNVDGVTGFCQTWSHLRNAVNALILLAYGSTDIQTTIGAGHVSGSGAVATGATNAEVFGLHEWWGNVWEMMDITYDTTTAGGVVQVVKPGTAGTLMSLGTNCVIAASRVEYPTEFDDDDVDGLHKGLLFIPVKESNTTAITSACMRDAVYNVNNSGHVLYCGGRWDGGSSAGPGHRSWNDSASYSGVSAGFRLARVVTA